MKSIAKRTEPNNGDPEIKNIPLADIRIDKTQSRARIDEDTVAEYAELIDQGIELPPVVVFQDEEGTYWEADGFHRLAAAQKREQKSIACEVHQGTMRDALRYSLKANAAHGLKRTSADKRKVVQIALGDEEWGQWSDGAIADLCGVCKNFVGTVRKEVSTSEVSSKDTSTATPTKTRKGRDGKLYSVKKRGLGKKTSGGTSHGPVKTAANGKEPSKNGTPDVSAKDVQHALELLAELGQIMETFGLHDLHCAALEQMTVSVEALELGDTNTIPNASRDVHHIPR